MKILDCTLRDGGYYTNWDFSKELVETYMGSLNSLPIDYIEIGYRSPLLKEYHGKYFYLPLYELEHLKKVSDKKLVIILNEKDIQIEHLDELLIPIKGIVTMIRMAIAPDNLSRAIELAKQIKSYGFEVGFNVMYMSKWKENPDFLELLDGVNGVADCFYMVDSYGGVFPDELIEIIELVKAKVTCSLGFHGHDNLQLALINTLTALEHGVEYIDATILGMGRGAGNLRTELLLTVLNKKYHLEVDFNALEKAVHAFDALYEKYKWGTNLPYMISGSSSLPQKDVMDWMTTRFYSVNSIIRALENKKKDRLDNDKYAVCSFDSVENVLIVGGGPSIDENINGILSWLSKYPETVIIHSSSKNAGYFKDIINKQYFCLVGNEGYRLESTLKDLSHFNGICILPPYPREMGTFVPGSVQAKTRELESVSFTDKYHDAHTALAIQVALNCKPSKVLFAGYDGYSADSLTRKEIQLNKENEYLFGQLKKQNIPFVSLTKSSYAVPSNENIFYLLSQK